MIIKNDEKKEAIKLRKRGKTYAKILAVVPIAKSTLSLWLREVGMAREQKQRITELRGFSQRIGALACKNQRIESSQKVFSKSIQEVGSISRRELWLIGTALY